MPGIDIYVDVEGQIDERLKRVNHVLEGLELACVVLQRLPEPGADIGGRHDLGD